MAHVAIAEAAYGQLSLARLDLVVSEVPLGKEHLDPAGLEARLEALHSLAAGRPWLTVASTPSRLLADVAAGYDVLVVGADKWAQLHDPAWYGSPAARDEALARLPRLVVAPRAGWPTPADAEVLDLDPDHRHVSSTAVRDGQDEWRASP
ncbi:hypothetical protein BH18ACT1_BH18ACT1_04490 [soil metagenome]